MKVEKIALLFIAFIIVVLGVLLFVTIQGNAQVLIENPVYLSIVHNGPTPRPTPTLAPTMDPWELDSGYPAPPTPGPTLIGPTATYMDPWMRFCLEFPDTNWCVDPSTRPDIDNPYLYRP